MLDKIVDIGTQNEKIKRAMQLNKVGMTDVTSVTI